jgi:hypothetical protein
MTSNSDFPDFDTMTPAEFEKYLPDFFANGDVSNDARLQKFLSNNPDCAALVRDLETIAKAAQDLFAPVEPSDALWNKIQDKMKRESIDDEAR